MSSVTQINSAKHFLDKNLLFLVYIGETGRNLSVRLKEHKTNCEKAEQDKAVAKHTWTYNHRINGTKQPFWRLIVISSHKMRESIEIEKHNTIDQEGKP